MIDTRDLVAELDSLEAQDEDELEADETERRDTLRALIDELSGYSGDDPRDGVTLIPERDFEDYARDFADDIGAVPSDATWPLTCIDWEQAARELAMDYTSVTFEGTEYLYR